AVFAFGLLIASIFSATILPVASAFYVCQAFGFEAGIDKTVKEAPQFYALYSSILLISACIVLLPNAPLIRITLWSQILNGLLLPVVLLFMIVLINNEEIMGSYTNKKFNNLVGWTTVLVLGSLSLLLVFLLLL
ncbi:MAG: divalent metal cation transporter, partial [SAR324 cluster bacterium]|nr:divalent metal cation transporter [SAR324 cluster bacterium]